MANYLTWGEELMKGDNKMTPNPKRQLQILNQDYVSKNDLRELYGWSKAQCKTEFIAIQHEVEGEGKRILNRGRTLLIPLDRILSKYPLSYKRIQRAVRAE